MTFNVSGFDFSSFKPFNAGEVLASIFAPMDTLVPESERYAVFKDEQGLLREDEKGFRIRSAPTWPMARRYASWKPDVISL